MTMGSSEVTRRHEVRRRNYGWIIDLLLILFFIYQAQILVNPIDDAYISFRYARNLAHGNGLVYNIGEQVEGISNLLWTVGLAGLYRAGISMLDAARLLNTFGLGCGIILCRAAMVHVFGSRSFWPRIALALIVLHTSIALSCGNLLEGSIVFLSSSLLIYASVRRSALGLALSAALFILNRPDGMAVALLIVLWSFYECSRGRFSARETILLASAITIVIAGLVLFRFNYYGDIIPNSLRSKALAARLSDRRLLAINGLQYLWEYYGQFWPLLCLIPFAFIKRNYRMLGLFVLATVTFNGLIVSINGGDWMKDYRLLTPYFPQVAFLIVLGAAALPGRWVLRVPAALGILCVGLTLLNSEVLHMPDPREIQSMFTWNSSIASMEENPSHRVTDHLETADFMHPDDKIVMDSGGQPAYLFDDVYAIEMWGLCQKELLSRNASMGWAASMGVVNPTALLSMKFTYFYQTRCPDKRSFLASEAYYREMGQFLMAFPACCSCDTKGVPFYVVRDDRVTLPQFIMDFAAIVPVQDYCRHQKFDLPCLTPWHEEPWRNTNGTVIAAGWHPWGDKQRLSWRFQQDPGTVHLSKPLEDVSPMVFLLGLPPHTRPGARITISVRNPVQELQPLDVIAAEDNPSDAFVTCASIIQPPPWTPGMEIVLDISSEFTFEPIFTLFRWTAAGTPAAPIEYIQQTQIQKQRREVRINGSPGAPGISVPSSSAENTMAIVQRRRTLLLRAAPLRHEIGRRPDNAQKCQELTRLFVEDNEFGMLLNEWKTLNLKIPTSPVPQYHLASAYARTAQSKEAISVLKDVLYRFAEIPFDHSTNVRDVLDLIDPVLLLQYIESQVAQYPNDPVSGILIANIIVNLCHRDEQAVLPSPDALSALLRHTIRLHLENNALFDALFLLCRTPREWDGLADFFLSLTVEDPKQGRAWYGLGMTEEKRGLLDAALATYENAFQRDPKQRLYAGAIARVSNARAQELIKSGDTAQAEKLFQRVQSLPVNGIDSFVSMGDVYMQQGRLEEARRAYRKAIETDPLSNETYEKLSELYIQQNDLDGLLAEWQSAVEKNPRSSLAWFSLGLAHERRNALEKAQDAYEKALELAPADAHSAQNALANVLTARGKALFKTGAIEEAAAAFQRAIDVAPQDTNALVALGEIRALQGNIEHARLAYRKAIATLPSAYNAYEKLSDLYVQQNDLDGLLKEWQAAVETAPKSALAWFSLGLTYERRDTLEKAQEAYEKALTLAPDAAGTKDALARVLTARGQAFLTAGAAADAEAAFQRATSISPQEENALIGLANAFAAQGNIENARLAYRKAIAALPSAYEAYDKLSNTFVQQGDLDGLLNEWQKAVEASPESALAWFSLGLAQERRNALEQAQEAYEKSLSFAPDAAGTKDALARVLTERARIFTESGQPAEAQALLERAKTLTAGR